jgi:hypothetical protein
MKRQEFIATLVGAATIVWPRDEATTRVRLNAGELGIRDKFNPHERNSVAARCLRRR